MSDCSDGDDEDKHHGQHNKKNVIRFPDGRDRQRVEKELRERARDDAKLQTKEARKQTELEEQYRKQYHEERAKRAQYQGQMARKSANGKQKFINWEKIPPFARFMVLALVAVQACMSLFASVAQRLQIIDSYGFVPARYTGGSDGVDVSVFELLVSPFTSLFLHGDWMHVVFNVVMLLAMGIFFERVYGTKRAVIFFVLCGIAGHLAYLLLNPFSSVPVIGASGAISGLFAVTIIVMSENGMMGPEAQRRGPVQFILLWIMIIVGMGLLTPGTAWQSHLGGFLGGIGFYYLWKRGILRF